PQSPRCAGRPRARALHAVSRSPIRPVSASGCRRAPERPAHAPSGRSHGINHLVGVLRPLSTQFAPYAWAVSTAEIARLAGIAPDDVLRFDGNTPPEPPPVARPETIRDALKRVNAYRHGGFPELLSAIAAYNGVEPANVVIGAGADDVLMLCARAYA